jgi:hypothetical protein
VTLPLPIAAMRDTWNPQPKRSFKNGRRRLPRRLYRRLAISRGRVTDHHSAVTDTKRRPCFYGGILAGQTRRRRDGIPVAPKENRPPRDPIPAPEWNSGQHRKFGHRPALWLRPLLAIGTGFAASATRSYNARGRRTNMSARSWTLHWLRVVLWPLPVLSLVRAGRAAATAVRHR